MLLALHLIYDILIKKISIIYSLEDWEIMIIKKRDGKKERFIPEKIVVSSIKAGAPPEVAREIAKKIEVQLSELNEMSTTELRDMILSMLSEKNPEWKENWLAYDRTVKKKR